MPDPITTIGLGAISAYLGKDGLQRLLGPTADYLGQELEVFARKRIENLCKIFANADSKLGTGCSFEGSVSPRVIKSIINEGSYADDQVLIDYFGGVLASSKSEVERDDRGVRLVKIIDSLSSYQVRAHYLLYSTISNIYKGRDVSIEQDRERKQLEIFIPYRNFMRELNLSNKENKIPQLVTHIFEGLQGEGLISENWATGRKEVLKTISISPKIETDGIICSPSTFGIELFMWAFGHANKDLEYIFSDQFHSKIEGMENGIEGSFSTYK